MKKKSGIILTILLAVFLSLALISCSGSVTGENGDGEKVTVDFSRIESVTVDETSVSEGFLMSEFDISMVKLLVQYFPTYENGNEVEGEVITVPVSLNMVKAEDKAKLRVPGTKTIRIVAFSRYDLEFSLSLYNDTETMYRVVFTDENGTPLYALSGTTGYTQYVPAGGRAVAPTVETKQGYTFVGWWCEEDRRMSSFDNISKDSTFRAVYEKNEFRVSYYSRLEGKDTLISTANVPRGENALNYAPDIPIVVGYSNGRWENESAMRNVTQDASFFAVYDKDQVNVSFTYKRYSANDETDVQKYDVGAKVLNPPSAEYTGFKFVEWRVNGKRASFPYDVLSEVSFEAYYIPVANGNDGLVYTDNSDPNGTSVSGYTGGEDVVVIPEKATVGGVLRDVTAIYDGVFRSVPVRSYVVSESNKYFITEDNVLYNRDKTILIAYPSEKSDASFVLPDTVTAIAPYAFYGAKNLVSVRLGNRVVSIGDYAFAECEKLADFSLVDSVTSIGDYAFATSGETSLTSISFSATSGLTAIGKYAFSGQSKISSYALPASLLSIGSGAFYGNKSLSSVTAVNNPSFRVSDGALYSDDYAVLYVYPALFTGSEYPVFNVNPACEKILSGAFSYARISSVVLHSAAEIEYESFVCPTLNYFRLIDANDLTINGRMFGDDVPENIVLPADATDLYDRLTAIQAYADSVRYETESEPIQRSYFANYYYEQYSYRTANGSSATGIRLLGTRASSETVDLPDTLNGLPVTAIGNRAFAGDEVMRTLSLPAALTEIGKEAFLGCKNLTAVNFGNEVTVVSDRAFADCDNLIDVHFQSDFTSIDSFGVDVFKNTLYLNENSAEFITLGNVLVKYNGYSTSVIVPTTVGYIATDAFKNKGQITTLSFGGNGLRVVDSYAFQFCTGLISVTFPSTLERVEREAFYGCSKLFVVTYSVDSGAAGLYVDSAAYPTDYYDVTQVYNNTQKYTLTYRVDSNESFIEQGVAFTEPHPVENTAKVRFDGWFTVNESGVRTDVLATFPMKLTEDTVLAAKSIDASASTDGLIYSYDEESDTYAVSGYNGTDDYVIVPAQYKNRFVRAVKPNAFLRSSVVYIELPNYRAVDGSVRSEIERIGEDAFSSTAWYRNFRGDFITIDDYLIKYTGVAETVYIPEGVTRLAEGAFAGNTAIKTVVFPSGLTSVSDRAFYGCASLEKVVFPSTLASIGYSSFKDCTSLNSINFSDCDNLNVIGYDAFDNTAWLNGYVGGCVMINDILYRYVDNPSIHVLHIGNGVSAINERAFFPSDNEKNVYLRSVYVPQSVTTIGASAFEESSVESINLFAAGSNLLEISKRAFYHCVNLSSIDPVVARSLTSIGEEAFKECASLRDVTIPASVVGMGEGAFENTGLNTVNFSSGSKLTTIPARAFKECRALYSVNFSGTSSLAVIGEEAFYNCVSLHDFNNLNAQVTTIGDRAFYNCAALTNFSLNASALVEIGDMALEDVGYVTGSNRNMVVLGNILIKFNGRESVVEIPANVTSIYNGAFKNNTFITEVVFPANSAITSINAEAFSGCSNLATINFPDSIVSVGEDVMKDTAWYRNKERMGDEYITISNTLVKYNGVELQQAVLPDWIGVINGGAFAGAKVYDIKLGNGVYRVKEGAFAGVDASAYPDWTITVEREDPAELTLSDPSEITAKYILLPDATVLDGYRLDPAWGELYDKMRVPHSVEVTFDVDEEKGASIAPITTHAIYREIDVETVETEDLTYIFVGWYFDREYTQKVTYPLLMPEDEDTLVLYAKFTDDTQGSNAQLYEVTGDVIDLYGFEVDDQGNVVETDSKIVVIGYFGETFIKTVGSGYYLDENGHYILNGSSYEYVETPAVGEETYAKRGAFENHTELVEVHFTKNSQIETIGEDAFKNCTKLEKVYLPNGIKRICSGAFAGCVSLKEIVFPSDGSDIVIESGAFDGCVGLHSVTLPSSVTDVRDGAFSGCTELTDVYMISSIAIDLGNALPFERNEGLIIHIPYGTYDRYAATWSAYAEYLVASVQ